MEDYNEDFATVLKVKGENFEEDTGGIWYDVHQTQAYNIDTVNAKLAGMHFTKVSMAERDRKMVKHIFEMKENYNKFTRPFYTLLRMISWKGIFGDRKVVGRE